VCVCVCVCMAVGARGTTVKLANIGDFGLDGPTEASVAALVNSWAGITDIFTNGDNNYPSVRDVHSFCVGFVCWPRH
jgi:hypothetical protein